VTGRTLNARTTDQPQPEATRRARNAPSDLTGRGMTTHPGALDPTLAIDFDVIAQPPNVCRGGLQRRNS
jgi:hypothetical protein